MPRGKKNPVRVTFQKVDPAARKHRETARHHSTKVGAPAVLHERSLESLWYDITPEGLTFLDWHRAWNGGYPDEHAVALYNELHPDENEQIELVEEGDEDAS